MISPRNRMTLGVLAVVGLLLCLATVAGFVWTVATNNLPFSAERSIRDFYLEVGRGYSQGFLAGFFTCFFLSLLVLAVSRRRGGMIISSRHQARERTAAASPRPGVGAGGA